MENPRLNLDARNQIQAVRSPSVSVRLNTVMPMKLTADNFLVWKNTITPILNGYDLFSFVENDPPAIKIMDGNGAVTDNPVYKVWWKNDQQVISFINSCVSESILSSIGKRNSAKGLWEALESSLSSKGRSRVSDLQRQIHTATKGNMTTDEYINMFKRLSEELSIVGYPVHDMSMMFAFLRGLGHDYIHFNISTNANLENLNFEKLVTNLKTHEACLSFYNQGNSSSSFPPMANQVQAS